MKKNIFIALLALAALLPARAENAAWVKAQTEAKASNKLVLLDFTGSDWCPACIMFHREVLEAPEFIAYSKTNLTVLVVDFPKFYPQSTAQHDANVELVQQFNAANPDGSIGFPVLMIVDADGKELTRQAGYRPGSGAKEFIARVEQLKAEQIKKK
ncbi:MAG: hypothetical protein RL616_1129 [Verrucomicrobiota bacterium]|jgi:thioredoxin-related protein